VEAWDEAAYMLMGTAPPGQLPGASGLSSLAIVRPSSAFRPLLLAGRLPRMDRVDEALINSAAATNEKLHVGSVVRLKGFSPDQTDSVLRGADVPPNGPTADVRVVGVGRFPSELSTAPPSSVIYNGNDFAFMTPAFFATYGDRVGIAGGVGMGVRLKRGLADFPAFKAAVSRLSPDAQVEPGSDDFTAASKARRATSLEALALLLFGALASLVALALVSQALGRQAVLDATEYPALSAMGMTRGQLVALAALRAAVIAAAGAVLAALVAFLLSSRMPIGIARQAEVSPGYSVDALVFAAGTAGIFLLIAGGAALSAWRSTRNAALGGAAASRPERPSRVADRLAQRGVPPSGVVGVRMALEPGRGATAVPVRTTLVSAVLAIAVLVATFGFGASLTRLATRPKLQGWNWDVSVGNPHSDDIAESAIPTLSNNPDVAAFAGLAGPADDRVDGHMSGVWAVDLAKGAVLPPFTEGRAPSAPDEIAFAAKDLRTLHRRVGQRVDVSAGGEPKSMLIVGRMVITPAVLNEQVDLGQGALVTKAGLDQLGGQAPENVFLVRLRSGVNRSAALAQLQSDFPGTVLSAVRPADVENLRRVDRLPSLLGALFAAVALLTVGHMLMSSVLRRRRDVAVLRTMGFVRRQVTTSVAWQATTVAVVGLVAGVPLGIAFGRWGWSVVAGQLGVPSEPVVPAGLVILTVAGTLVAANALAALPALLAARTHPAEILRAE
jgi:ABC-type antimicrobial peptide transport system permease subunit